MSSSPGTTTDVTAANTAAVRRLAEAANSRDLAVLSAAFEEAFAPDVRMTPQPPVQASGVEALQQVWANLLTAFPDIRVTIEDLVAVGDRVATRHSVTGTNLGPHLGRPATGRRVDYGEIFFFRFVDGRIVETWGLVDVQTQLRQLGAIPGAVA